ncbi:MAG: single-stranded-DNA-specific exonuclease RecJ [Anaerolineae bacterium]
MQTLIRKRWRFAPQAPDGFIRSLSSSTSSPALHPLVAQVLYNRGLVKANAALRFLNQEPALGDPFELAGVAEGVALAREAITRGDRIAVYGDYDVDGVTAAAVLIQTLRSLGGRVCPYIPSREDEGYGLNREAIETLATEGVRLLITVDCGIRSLEEVALARRLGLRVIVTDHHNVSDELPPADAVINPKRLPVGAAGPGDFTEYDAAGFSDLAGVGVAFKLAQALLRANRERALDTTQWDLAEEELLDLVALGTVADMVALVDENHALVAKGLERINSGRHPGLGALMRVVGVEPGQVTTKTIGFVLAPRLNAAGRMDEAMTALELLLAPDMAAALPLAERLDRLNQERREITGSVHQRARDLALGRGDLPPLLFAASPDFPSGVVGLAASRLLDEFYRPSIVVAVEDEYSKGSARSIPEFHITEALDAMHDLLERHGGHAAAAGFTVRTSRLDELRHRLMAVAEEKLQDTVLIPTLHVDAEVPLEMLSWELYREMERLQPFGFGNPEPVFVSRHVRVLEAKAVGNEGRHLKLYLADRLGQSWDAIAFRQGHWAGRLAPSGGCTQYIDIAYHLERNEWNGRVTLQLNVQDIHDTE